MVFIKGAWIELRPEDDRYQNYFCCPKHRLYITSHIEEYNPATGKGLKHDPPMWITAHCGLLKNMRELPITEGIYNPREVIIPDWCPLRS